MSKVYGLTVTRSREADWADILQVSECGIDRCSVLMSPVDRIDRCKKSRE